LRAARRKICIHLLYIVFTNDSPMFPIIPRVKICCIASEEEAALAVSMGTSAVGLVSRMPSGPGPIPESRIRDIARIVPPGVATFLLTSETTAEPIIAQQKYTGANTLQLVDEVAPAVYAALRDAAGNKNRSSRPRERRRRGRGGVAVVTSCGRNSSRFRESVTLDQGAGWNRTSARLGGESQDPRRRACAGLPRWRTKSSQRRASNRSSAAVRSRRLQRPSQRRSSRRKQARAIHARGS